MRKTAIGLMAVGLGLAGCSMGSAGRQGSALAVIGLQSQSTMAVFEAKVGDEVMFALPAFDNSAGDPITIESVRVLTVPAGFQIIGYRTLDYKQSDGMMLAWDSRTSKDSFPAMTMSEPWVKGIVVPARTVGQRYAVVHARVRARPAGAMENVDVVYKLRGATYHQEMVGRWLVRMVGEPHTYT